MRAVRCVVLVVGVLATLLLAGSAQGIPSDPPVTPIEPADGATLATNQNGIGVSFQCPNYNQAEPITMDGVTYTFPGSSADYFVDFATKPDLGNDGRFAQSNRVDLSTASTTNELPAGTCVGVMRDEDAVPGIQLTPGTYYWMVARTLGSCLGCTPVYETGPIRSFTLRNEVKLTVNPKTTIYSGYAHRFELGTEGVADGLGVVLERKTPQAWVEIGRGTSRDGKALAFATLPKGKQQVRLAFELGGQRSYGGERTVTVKNSKTAKRTTGGSVGSWTGLAEGAPSGEKASFKVVKGGREIRNLKVPVLLGCPNPGPTGGEIILQSPGVIRMSKVKVAPNGRFAKAQPDSQGIAEVSGQLKGGKLREGTAALVRGQCTIAGGLTAKRTKK